MVFTGIEMLFFLLGVIVTVAIYAMVKYNRQYKFKVLTWILLCIGILFFVFGFAWAASSFLEGVPRAASMGLVFFCLPALILLLLGRRLALRNS